MFSYEFCEIFKNTSFDRTPLVAASKSRSLICQTKAVCATRTKHMPRATLLFMAPEQLPGKYLIKQANQEDLSSHGSFLTVASPSIYLPHGYIKPFILKGYLVISATTC